jgi:serine O-acetyltransferase
MINAYKLYFIANYLYRKNIPLIPSLIKLIIFLIYNCSVPFECEIGKGSRFGYSGIGVVLHKNCVIGKNVMIGTNVTVGGRSNLKDVPIIGDNVYIGTGAKILGPIIIGDNVTIGANSVVISDVKSGLVVAGVPAKVIHNSKV